MIFGINTINKTGMSQVKIRTANQAGIHKFKKPKNKQRLFTRIIIYLSSNSFRQGKNWGAFPYSKAATA
jgi:hypothetical protein